jgi:hypothetical protein
MNGSTVTKTGGTVNLGTVITAHQDISGKADKSATVSTVAYDATNKKLTKTINGTTSDVVTTAQLKTDMALSKSDVGLGNVGNFKAVSTVASQGLTDTEKANARANIGLGNVNNTSDANKPISTAAQAALDSQQEQINYNTNNGVKNLLYTKPASVTRGGLTATCTSPNKYNISGTTTNINETTILFTNLSTGDISTTDSQYPSGNPFGTGDFILSGKIPEGIMFQILIAKSLPLTASNYRVIAISAYTPSQPITLDSTDKYVWVRLAYYVSATKTYNEEVEIMMRSAEIEDDTFVPYAEPNSELTAKTNAALKQTGYNLLEITQPSQTINGVTFTVDKAVGTITANGTASQTTFFAFKLQIDDGKYVLSGCPPTGSDSTYRIDIRNGIAGITFTNAVDYGTGTSAITLSGNKYFHIRIANGYNCSNLVFKPMIVPAELAGVPFQPYAKSNAELTSGKLDVTGNADTPYDYDDLPDHFELWTSPGPANSNGNLWIKMRSYSTSVDSFLLLANDDTLQYFGIEKDNFVVQTKDANSYYEFKDDGIYLNGTRIAP